MDQTAAAARARSAGVRSSARHRPERRAGMTWAQRLKRVFGIDLQTCVACGGALRIIACIEDPVVIEKILAHPLGFPQARLPTAPDPLFPPPQANPTPCIELGGDV